MVTSLQVTGTPGGLRSFSPKTEAVGGPADQITELSALAVPGGLHSFSAKDEAGGGGSKPGDQVTELSVLATPSGLRAFVAKGEAIVEQSAVIKGSGGYDEDEEIIAIVLSLTGRMYTLH